MPDEAPDNPAVAFKHTMGAARRTDTYEFTYHGYGVSHMDSLCHFLWNDRLYNDNASSSSTSKGCGKLGIQNLKRGIVTRGVLLRLRAAQGGAVPGARHADLHRRHRGMGTAGEGEGLTGRRDLRAHGALGEAQRARRVAGVDQQRGVPCIRAAVDIKTRGVAIVGSDAATDVMPSRVEGVVQPVHTMLLAGFGTNISTTWTSRRWRRPRLEKTAGSSC